MHEGPLRIGRAIASGLDAVRRRPLVLTGTATMGVVPTAAFSH
jgi:hypothetical protein